MADRSLQEHLIQTYETYPPPMQSITVRYDTESRIASEVPLDTSGTTNISNFMDNFTRFFNITPPVYDYTLLDEFANNRRVSVTAYYGLITAYCVLILFGALGNGLVVLAVLRKPAMRNARNLFIVNLAVSDLVLCLVTMPVTLMEILTKYWPLGSQVLLCKLAGSLQATSIFVSTISITAIALDRYQVIVYPTRSSLQRVGAAVTVACIWGAAFLLALPLFVWRTLKHYPLKLESIGIDAVNYCLEEWPMQHGRAYYSLFCIVFQYVLPIVTVSIAYARICRKLKGRLAFASSSVGKAAQEKQAHDSRRMRRTNTLLISIALIFCVCWLPLNTFNVVVDLYDPFGDDTESMLVFYAACHMAGMSSACSNPLLYGWLNDNFRKEFQEIAEVACCGSKCVRRLTANMNEITRRSSSFTAIPSQAVAEEHLGRRRSSCVMNSKGRASLKITRNSVKHLRLPKKAVNHDNSNHNLSNENSSCGNDREAETTLMTTLDNNRDGSSSTTS